ncbi:MAG: hypothetical protein HZA05_07655 [Nitrospirae bacterium]|nr:hypothetical protein [Nitrospirota bacterium]
MDRYFFLRKPKAVLEELQREGLTFEHRTFQPVTWKDFELCHAPEYVEAVKTGAPRELAESCAISWSKEFAETLPYMTSCNFFQSGVFPCKSNGFVIFL